MMHLDIFDLPWNPLQPDEKPFIESNKWLNEKDWIGMVKNGQSYLFEPIEMVEFR